MRAASFRGAYSSASTHKDYPYQWKVAREYPGLTT